MAEASPSLADYVDDPWPNPLTVPERIDWEHALEGLAPETIVKAVTAMTAVTPGERPGIPAFLAVIAGVLTADDPVPTPVEDLPVAPPEQRSLSNPTPPSKAIEVIRNIREAAGLDTTLPMKAGQEDEAD